MLLYSHLHFEENAPWPVIQAALDALPDTLCVIDKEGRVVLVNESWREFGRRNGYADPSYGVGTNYIDQCHQATANGDPLAGDVLDGIYDLKRGSAANFEMMYPCHGPMEDRWFRLRGRRMGDLILLVHEDATAQVHADNAARRIARRLDAYSTAAGFIALRAVPMELDRIANAVFDGHQLEQPNLRVMRRLHAPMDVLGDPLVCAEAITYLLQHALRNGRETVALYGFRTKKNCIIEVHDDETLAPGIEEHILKDARGFDDLRAADAIARAHGGSLMLSRRNADGGLNMGFRLPRRRPMPPGP